MGMGQPVRDRVGMGKSFAGIVWGWGNVCGDGWSGYRISFPCKTLVHTSANCQVQELACPPKV